MTEQKKEYWKPSVTADIVVVDIHQAKFREDGNYINILLIQRAANSEAFPNCWALPGGFLDKGESLEQCAARELKEETGLEAENLMPIGVYSNPIRDPRGQVISHAFMSVFPSTDEQPLKVAAGDDAKDFGLFNLKGKFSREDGTLSVRLRCPKNDKVIEFKATFSQGALGLLQTKIEYKSADKLAFDHAEIIARAILRTPDLVLPTTTKPMQTEESTEKQ